MNKIIAGEADAKFYVMLAIIRILTPIAFCTVDDGQWFRCAKMVGERSQPAKFQHFAWTDVVISAIAGSVLSSMNDV